MADKQKQIPKEEAYGIFLIAFERLGVECSDSLEGNQWLKKPKRGAYKKLADELIEVFLLNPDDISFYNYSNYLKDRFNDIKKLLKHDYKTYFGYSVERFQPLIDYANRHLGTSTSVIFSKKIIFRRTQYSVFDFWRSVKIGKLIKYPNHYSFESANERFTFSRNLDKVIIKNPPYKGEWIQLQTENQSFHLAVSDGHGKLDAITPLDDFLSDIQSQRDSLLV